MKLSALVLAKDEEEMIGDALSQLDFADEIILLDQGSKDKTVQIAKKYTDKIINSPLQNFAKNRNILKENAKGEWLLYIDPDERLSKEVIFEIKEVIKKKEFCAYYFPRKNFILGKLQKHGGWYPDYVPRLFLKEDLIKWGGEVHESPQIKGTYGYLINPISHNTARSLSKMLQKSIRWAKVEAELYYKSNSPKVTIPRVLKFSTSEFVNRYFLKLGAVDGKVGLISAIYQALHRVMILTYLWEMQQKSK